MSSSPKALAICMLLALTALGGLALPSAEAAEYGILNGQAPLTAALASAAGAPVNTAPPLLSGSPIAGETLTASNGEWQGEPSAFAYQWLQCRNGVRGSEVFSCTPIPGANSAQYALTVSDQSLFIAVEVTATNAFGSSAARSAVSKPVVPPHAPSSVRLTLKPVSAKVRPNEPVPIAITNNSDISLTGVLKGYSLLAKHAILRFGSEAFTVSAHAKVVVKLQLPKALRLKLTRRHKLWMTLVAGVGPQGGTREHVGEKVIFRLARG